MLSNHFSGTRKKAEGTRYSKGDTMWCVAEKPCRRSNSTREWHRRRRAVCHDDGGVCAQRWPSGCPCNAGVHATKHAARTTAYPIEAPCNRHHGRPQGPPLHTPRRARCRGRRAPSQSGCPRNGLHGTATRAASWLGWLWVTCVMVRGSPTLLLNVRLLDRRPRRAERFFATGSCRLRKRRCS